MAVRKIRSDEHGLLILNSGSVYRPEPAHWRLSNGEIVTQNGPVARKGWWMRVVGRSVHVAGASVDIETLSGTPYIVVLPAPPGRQTELWTSHGDSSDSNGKQRPTTEAWAGTVSATRRSFRQVDDPTGRKRLA